MARKPRIEYPGAIYHVTSRAIGNGSIVRSDVDRNDFVKTLAEACEKTGFRVHAYCLMRNQFHLVVETPNANLVAGMGWLMSAYTLRFNRRHQRPGHVFSGRYKALVVDGSAKGYLQTVCDYVHLSPVRARLVKPGQRLLEYPWSSFGCYVATPRLRPGWLRVDRLLGEHGIRKDDKAGRQAFERRMEDLRALKSEPDRWQALRRGWCFGPLGFKEKLLELLEGKQGAHHRGRVKSDTAQTKAERIIREELKKRRWREKDLEQRAKSDPEKLAIAARLRRETTLTIPAIAIRLHMGTWKSFTAKLHCWKKAHAIEKR